MIDKSLIRLTPSEARAARAAGYLTTSPGRQKSSAFFGGMMAWASSLLGRATFWTGSGNAKPPVNSASSNTGQIVSPDSALTLSAFWACVWLNARTLASLPLDLKRYDKNGKATIATGETLYDVLRWKPNRDMSAFDFWTALWANEQVWGTGYAEKIRNGGRTIALEPLLSQWMVPFLTDAGELRYRYHDPVKPREFAGDQIFKVFSRSLDGLTGLSVVEYGRNSFGLAQSGELAASRVFKKGLQASGFVTTEKFLSKTQRTTFQASLDDFGAEGAQSGGTMLLEGGTKYQQLSLKPQDAELLTSRQFSVEDVCRWFGVPPILIGHASQGQTMWGSGVEQIFGGWARLALRPYTVACVQRVRGDLLSAADRVELYAEYDFDELLAADSNARAQLYASLSQNGIQTRNELREKEGLSPLPGGDQLTVQSNLVPLEKLGEVQGTGGTGGSAQKLRNALLELLALESPPPPKKDGP